MQVELVQNNSIYRKLIKMLSQNYIGLKSKCRNKEKTMDELQNAEKQ